MKQFFTYVKNDFISRLKSKKSKFKGVSYAFTLAEVLITLGIIGVVAAMTLPTLIQNHQKQTYVTGLKKAYSVLQNAFAQMAVDEGVTDWKQTACSNLGLNDCSGNGSPYVDTSANCLNSLQKSFKLIDMKIDNTTDYLNRQFVTLIASDGIRYSFEKSDVGATHNYTIIAGISDIDVDINGDKGPNKYGRDKFYFHINYDKNKIEPDGLSNYQTYCTPQAIGGKCTAKVLIEGKMDY